MRTDQGRVRDHNEDYIAFIEPNSNREELSNGWLYIVADGVGGAEAGEVASEYATERTIFHYLNNRNESDYGQRLIQAMQAANGDLRELIYERATGKRMATTMVAAVVHDSTVTMANVGDSRGYHWRDGVLRQVTKDQSLVAKLVEEGVITEEEALDHPRKNVILQSLGSEDIPQIEIFEVELNPFEQLVLCSDGLIRHVSDQEISTIIGKQNPEQATKNLIRLANSRGGEDNITVAVLQIGDIQEPSDMVKSPVYIAAPYGRAVSDSDLDRGAFWFQTATFTLMYLILVLLIWIITGR